MVAGSCLFHEAEGIGKAVEKAEDGETVVNYEESSDATKTVEDKLLVSVVKLKLRKVERKFNLDPSDISLIARLHVVRGVIPPSNGLKGW